MNNIQQQTNNQTIITNESFCPLTNFLHNSFVFVFKKSKTFSIPIFEIN